MALMYYALELKMHKDGITPCKPQNLQGVSIYTPQGLPAVFSSVLASSVIVIAARAGLLPPCIVLALGLRLKFPESYRDHTCGI